MAIYKGEQCLAGVGKNATIKIGTAKPILVQIQMQY